MAACFASPASLPAPLVPADAGPASLWKLLNYRRIVKAGVGRLPMPKEQRGRGERPVRAGKRINLTKIIRYSIAI